MTTHHEYHVRPAVPADAPAILDLIGRAMALYVRNSGIATPLESQQEKLEDHVRHIQTDHVLIAEQDGHIAGTVRLILEPGGLAYFSRFAVEPHRQRGGVGRLLYAAAEAWFHAQGVRSILLHTALSNQPLVDFYKSRGFRLIEENTARGYPRGTFQKDLP
jgi:ribosomal protein S18 acetylase RimI-like enzyme